MVGYQRGEQGFGPRLAFAVEGMCGPARGHWAHGPGGDVRRAVMRRVIRKTIKSAIRNAVWASMHGGGGSRGWGGHWGGPPFGKHWGGPPFGKRRFGRGDMKYVILELLKEQPRHGYDIIRALEERFGGMYSPSPGSVYPTLQLLEDQGYVRSSEVDGKRTYTITGEGLSFLEERAATVDDIRKRMHEGFAAFGTPEMRDLMQEIGGLGQFLMGHLSGGALKDPEKRRKLRDVFARMRSEVEDIFREEDGPTPPETI